ncbi:Protein NLRC5, partial [Geodia barretti]
MKDMMRSPESQQEKTISLVDAVDETIKSKPDLLFVFIEVLLEDEDLQAVGREMSRETGILHPDRTHARLPNIPLPTTDGTGRARGSQETMPTTAGNTVSQLDIALPLIGDGISAPQSGLSRVLTNYKSYLQSIYNARALAPADKYLPTLDAPYINLAMIIRGRYDTEQRDEFTRRTLHGGVDQILQSKVPIEIEDLLTFEWKDDYLFILPYLKALIQEFSKSGGMPVVIIPEEIDIANADSSYSRLAAITRGMILWSKKPVNIEELLTFDWKDNYLLILPFLKALIQKSSVSKETRPDLLTQQDRGEPGRFILVEGPPGIGKSTFAWEACRRWDDIESLRGYHTVVLLKLREKWVLNATALSDLFRHPVQPSDSKDIAKELHDSHGCNLLLVLDGFDEVSHSFHKDSVIKRILCRQLLPKCAIILTTRPVAKSALRSICQPKVDKHVEIIGFTEEERVRYITKVFSNKPELQANFLKYMFLVPHIKSMMYIPLNCAIIAQVYYESQSSRHLLAIPKTRTQLYQALTHSILVRHMRMKKPNHECTSMLPEGLNKRDKNKFRVLAQFAFVNYHQGGSRLKQVTFFKEDIPEGFVSFGFMNESTEMYASRGMERTLSFLHLSLQEYLAAWHLADTFSTEFQVA